MRRNHRRYRTMNEGYKNYSLDSLRKIADEELERIKSDIDTSNKELKKGVRNDNIPTIVIHSAVIDDTYDRYVVLLALINVLRDADEDTDIEEELISKIKGLLTWLHIHDRKADVYLDYASNLDSWLL